MEDEIERIIVDGKVRGPELLNYLRHMAKQIDELDQQVAQLIDPVRRTS